jgi:glycosyltransferase involved in cell wall biosynthesis
MSKKVWYISKYAVPVQVGNPTRQFFLAKKLSEIGNIVTLIYSRSTINLSETKRNFKNSVEYLDGFTHVMLDGPKIDLGFNFIRIWSWIEFEIRLWFWVLQQKEKPDTIIVSSLSILTFITGIFAKKRFGCKLILEVRDIYPYTLTAVGKFTKNNIFIRLLSFIEKIGYRNADIILSPLSSFDKYLADYYKNYLSKYVHLPIGVDLDYYKIHSDEINEYLDSKINGLIPDGKFVVAYFGSFGKVNNISMISALINELASEKDIFFVISGNGPDKETFLKEVKNKINYIDLGSIKKHEIPIYLSRCDLAIHPILDLEIYKYGLSPNKWIDYMYSAIPFIVCFNGNIEMLFKAACASIIPPENLNELKKEIYMFKNMNSTARKEIGLSGKKYLLENLTYEKHVKTLSELI